MFSESFVCQLLHGKNSFFNVSNLLSIFEWEDLWIFIFFARMSDLYIYCHNYCICQQSLSLSFSKKKTTSSEQPPPSFSPASPVFSAWMSRWKLGCKWLVNGLLHLLTNGVYWGYNPFTNHLLSS